MKDVIEIEDFGKVGSGTSVVIDNVCREATRIADKTKHAVRFVFNDTEGFAYPYDDQQWVVDRWMKIRNEAQQELRDREEYERLKLKFEGK